MSQIIDGIEFSDGIFYDVTPDSWTELPGTTPPVEAQAVSDGQPFCTRVLVNEAGGVEPNGPCHIRELS